MQPEKQAQNYDQIAHHWSTDSFDQNNGIAQHQRALQFCKTKKNAIDIGCGSSGRIISLLLEQGFVVEGMDSSREMLRLAKENHPQLSFYHADICHWALPRRYDFISAWDSIWHVPLAQQDAVIGKLCAALKPGGVFVFTSGAVDEPGEVTNPCHGQDLYHAAPGIPALLRILEASGCICRHLENDDWPNRHLYIIAQKS